MNGKRYRDQEPQPEYEVLQKPQHKAKIDEIITLENIDSQEDNNDIEIVQEETNSYPIIITTLPTENIFYEEKLADKHFLQGYWKVIIENERLSSVFSITNQHNEARTGIPIIFKLSHRSPMDNMLFFTIEIKDLSQDYHYESAFRINLEGNQTIKGFIGECTGNDQDSYAIQLSNEFIEKSMKDKECIIIDSPMLIIIDVQIYRKRHSEAVIPFCGMKNSNMNCYMNSIFQMIFMLGALKKAILNEVMNKESKRFIIQTVFYNLLNATPNTPVSLKSFLYSMGWGNNDNLQHDVEEFFIFLSALFDDNDNANNTKSNIFNDLFQGKLRTNVKCINISHESNVEESFIDLSLTVKNCKNIYQSFDNMTMEELLHNKNQYSTDNSGLQDAYKTVSIISFPKVLLLQLNRSDYDLTKRVPEKINDYFEFYDTIDLTKYSSASNKTIPLPQCQYQCHSVIVHNGLYNNGHYYSMIRPHAIDDSWYNFNDERISHVEKYEVFHNNFGGDSIKYNMKYREILEERKQILKSAYLLLYIRKDCLEEVLCDYTVEMIPKRLSYAIKRPREGDTFMDIGIVTWETLKNYQEEGLTECIGDLMEDNDLMKERMIVLKVHKDYAIVDFLSLITKQTNLDKEDLRCYVYMMKRDSREMKAQYNLRYLPSEVIESNITFSDIKEAVGKSGNDFMIYLHYMNEGNILEMKDDKSIGNKKVTFYGKNQSQRSNKKMTITYHPEDNNYYFKKNIIIIPYEDMALDKKKEESLLVIIKVPLIIFNDDDHSFKIKYKLLTMKVIEKSKEITMNDIFPMEDMRQVVSYEFNRRFNNIIKDHYASAKIEYLIDKYSLDLTIRNEEDYIQLKGDDMLSKTNCIDYISLIVNVVFNETIQLNHDVSFKSFKDIMNFDYKTCDKKIEQNEDNYSFVCILNHLRVMTIPSSLSINDTNSNIEVVRGHLDKLLTEKVLYEIFNINHKENPGIYIQTNEEEIERLIDIIKKDDQHKIIEVLVDNHIEQQDIQKQEQTPSLSPNPSITPNDLSVNMTPPLPLKEIFFTINIDNISTNVNHRYHSLSICDQYTNPMRKLFFSLDLLNTHSLYDLLTKHTTALSLSSLNTSLNLPSSQFILLCFNTTTLTPLDSFIYQTIPINNFLTHYTKDINVEYAYYPYIENIHKDEINTIIYICIYSLDGKPITLPFILLDNLEYLKLIHLKETIISTLKGKRDLSSFANWKSFKLFKYALNNKNKPVKTYHIKESDETMISTIFPGELLHHGMPCNIYVELDIINRFNQ